MHHGLGKPIFCIFQILFLVSVKNKIRKINPICEMYAVAQRGHLCDHLIHNTELYHIHHENYTNSIILFISLGCECGPLMH
jgi:hypothetical protein